MAWVRACAVEDLMPGDALRVDADPPVAVFNVGGMFYATADTCTHAESSLADGYLVGNVVECAIHFAKFDVRTGDVVSPPAPCPLQTFEVRIEDGAVHVAVPDTAGVPYGGTASIRSC